MMPSSRLNTSHFSQKSRHSHRLKVLSIVMAVQVLFATSFPSWSFASELLQHSDSLSPSGQVSLASLGYEPISFETVSVDRYREESLSLLESIVAGATDLYDAAKQFAATIEEKFKSSNIEEDIPANEIPDLSLQSDDTYFNSQTISSTYTDMWWHDAVRASAAWGISKGYGVTVAVVDTGTDLKHQDINDNLWVNSGEIPGNGIDDDGNGYVDDIYGWNFANNNNDVTDDNGHGTHVAGIISAEADNGIGIAGIAPGSNIMTLKALNANGGGSFGAIANSVRYAADMGAKVINLSLGAAFNYSLSVIQQYFSGYYNAYIKPFRDAIQYAISKGSVVVAAAGNSNINVAYTVPAGFEEIITVGATAPGDQRAYFSNWGSGLDIAAPGWDILSLRAANTNMGYAVGGEYTRAWGTSMASPIVAGVAALMMSQDLTQNADDIHRRLMFSAKDIGSTGFDTSFGYGLVNAEKAVQYDWYLNGGIKSQWLFENDADGAFRINFDPQGRISEKLLADGGRISYSYDGSHVTVLLKTWINSEGVITRKIDAENSQYEFDGSGILVKKIFADGTVHTFFTDGKINKIINTDGSVKTYNQTDLDGDGVGRLISEVTVDGVEIQYLNFYAATDQHRESRSYVNGKLQQVSLYDSNGNLVYVRKLRSNGSREFVKQYASDGRLTQESSFSNEDQLLISKTYWENGQLRAVIDYQVASLRVQKRYYYETGVLRQKVDFISDNTRKQAEFYSSDGKVNRILIFDSNNLISTNTVYNNDGNKIFEATFSDGVIQSRSWWREDGTLKKEVPFTNGIRTLIKIYSANGTKIFEANYSSEGILQSRYWWRDDGTLKMESHFDSNGNKIQLNLHGSDSTRITREFNPETGARVKEIRYAATGEMTDRIDYNGQGIRLHWLRYENQLLKFLIEYQNGELHSTTEYDGKGNVVNRIYHLLIQSI